jgi:hypothetical protein
MPCLQEYKLLLNFKKKIKNKYLICKLYWSL